MNDITIIGGGWSVRNVVLDAIPGTIIAVNDSAVLAPRWDHAVSMDRLWTEGRIDQIRQRIEGMPPDPKRPVPKVWIRKSALQNVGEKVATMPYVHPFTCDHESSSFVDQPGHLNGPNSGACALNLAWQLRPARVFLLGFDMNRDDDGRAYWYPPYPWSSPVGSTSDGKYRKWAEQFRAAAHAFALIRCQVFNVNPKSAINNFRRITPAEFSRAVR